MGWFFYRGCAKIAVNLSAAISLNIIEHNR